MDPDKVNTNCHFCGCPLTWHGISGYCNHHKIYCSNDGKNHRFCDFKTCGCKYGEPIR